MASELRHFDESVEFALRRISKEMLQLSSHQLSALKSSLSGKDTFLCLPTGQGKSIVFECFPYCYDFMYSPETQQTQPSSVLIVSPLISLMASQVSDLQTRNQSALRLSCDMKAEDVSKLKSGHIRYVFCAPEALDEDRWKDSLRTSSVREGLNIRAVFCDEAHCIEAWGSGLEPFRQSYSKLAAIQSFLPSGVPFVALTATATTSTVSRISKSLNMIHPVIISISPNRINLRYSVIHVSKNLFDRFAWLLEELRIKRIATVKTVVFCRSIANCASLYQLFDFNLQDAGYDPKGAGGVKNAMFGMFHAKVTDFEKGALLKSFSNPDGVCRVLFATVAFGLGINIPNIYRVIHDGPTRSVDQYVQESGRGGRNGNVCEVVLYSYSGSTKGKISTEMKNYGRNTEFCRRIQLMQYFPGKIELPQHPHLCCDFCTMQCLCGCTCAICNCDKPKSPCKKCCICANRCTYALLKMGCWGNTSRGVGINV